MPLSESKIKTIFNKHKKAFEEMEHYDETREKLWAKKRIDITLTGRVIAKLKEKSKLTGKPISHLIEEAVSRI